MTSYITTKLEFVGDSDIIEELRNFIRGDNDVIDFEVIIPRDMSSDDTLYYWREINWNTKWNAFNQHEICDDIIEFQTGGSCPYLIIDTLSKKYPDITITVMYADENMGENAGIYTIINGEVTKLTDDSRESKYNAYFEVNGDSSECLVDAIESLVFEESFNHSLVIYVVNKLNLTENYQSILNDVSDYYGSTINLLYNHFILKTKLKAFLSDEKE